MNYTVTNDKILIENPDYFSAKDILTCGQIFRYSFADDVWRVRSGAHFAEISERFDRVIVTCDDAEYFRNFFDLDNDYAAIINELYSKPLMSAACDNGRGIRILKGETGEIIFSFIISANNNIKRIQGIIERLCETVGAPAAGGGFAFPTARAIAALDVPTLNKIGCGYRSPYLIKTAEVLADGAYIERLSAMDTAEARESLLRLSGVGGKVADCILLFGLHKTDVFPVDTWIEKVYLTDLGGAPQNREGIRRRFTDLYGGLSGYAQQYLFYGKRES
ncbi:MAG: DNA-3-methyladenine glycosylase 2 [Clostridiales bacterium]|jgi:N-glycosylase/DNA lyase|nr:DNA-3-methyladenine glycosylase 2 [Clostridiales bacterium]